MTAHTFTHTILGVLALWLMLHMTGRLLDQWVGSVGQAQQFEVAP